MDIHGRTNEFASNSLGAYSWFATAWQGSHVGWHYNIIISSGIYMEIELRSERRETLLFLSFNMAAVTSCANQQTSNMMRIGHFRVLKTLFFKTRPGAQPFLWKKSFICMRMKNHFHIKGRARNFVLIQRPGGTRKWLVCLKPV